MTKHIVLALALFANLTACATEPAPQALDVESDTSAFTLDHRGFFDDGIRWWTASSGPLLHGRLGTPRLTRDHRSPPLVHQAHEGPGAPPLVHSAQEGPGAPLVHPAARQSDGTAEHTSWLAAAPEAPVAIPELRAYVGELDVGAATMSGDEWSIQLPVGAIDRDDVQVVLELASDPPAVRVQTFGYDPTLPRLPRPIQ
jgi:hypothetical protein